VCDYGPVVGSKEYLICVCVEVEHGLSYGLFSRSLSLSVCVWGVFVTT
jgi:hypothetical protein